MTTPRDGLGAVTDPDVRIYAIGGYNGGPETAVEAYTPGTDSWATVAPMPTARGFVAATVGPDGRIYAIGGYNGATYLTTEAYTPGTNSWATVAPMPTVRAGLGAATGPDGRIYAIGGSNGATFLTTVEAYNTGVPTAVPEVPLTTLLLPMGALGVLWTVVVRRRQGGR
jgi:N-acetylneuraminic acid mutarotase